MTTAKLKWFKGPPPHVGWWNASVGRNPKSWRWWNGKHWSKSVSPLSPSASAKAHAQRPALSSSTIRWTHYWPEGARVPRINPDTQEIAS